MTTKKVPLIRPEHPFPVPAGASSLFLWTPDGVFLGSRLLALCKYPGLRPGARVCCNLEPR